MNGFFTLYWIMRKKWCLCGADVDKEGMVWMGGG
ncbi:hypothetical protein AYI68_g5953, partial [Smittium mucronatum]